MQGVTMSLAVKKAQNNPKEQIAALVCSRMIVGSTFGQTPASNDWCAVNGDASAVTSPIETIHAARFNPDLLENPVSG